MMANLVTKALQPKPKSLSVNDSNLYLRTLLDERTFWWTVLNQGCQICLGTAKPKKMEKNIPNKLTTKCTKMPLNTPNGLTKYQIYNKLFHSEAFKSVIKFDFLG
jgi:hypothetical protein